MKYLRDQGLVEMDLVDLEHCGFDHGNFDFELQSQGIDDIAARWPMALIINFRGGHIVTAETCEETKASRSKAGEAFEMLLAKLLSGARPEESTDG